MPSRDKTPSLRFASASATYDAHAKLQRQMACDLAANLCRYRSRFERVLEVGAGTGFLTTALCRQSSVDTYIVNDLSIDLVRKAKANCLSIDRPHPNFVELAGDAEHLPWPDELDLVASSACVQWFVNPLHFVELADNALSDGGLLAFTTFLPGTFHETESILGVGLAYPDVSLWQEKLSEHFVTVHLDVQTHVCRFDAPKDVLRHFKATGVNNCSADFVWTKTKLAEFEKAYRQRFSTVDDGVTLTFVSLSVIARKRTK